MRLIFTMFDKNEKELAVKEVFINGSQYVFGDSTVSNSSLKINEVGNFKCYTTTPADSIGTYVSRIIWKDYKYD